jgi:hypothetical protein
MIGQKLHDLLDVLSISHVKLLDFKCVSSSDKRLIVLKQIIHEKELSIERLNEFLDKEVRKLWPNSSEKEHNLKIRRTVNYFVDQIEKVILDSFLEKNSAAKNVLLAKAVEKTGNMNLLNRYFDKAYSISVEEEDNFYQLMGLNGKIRMRYASQSEKDLEEALHLNEEFITVLKYTNDQKLAEYYNNISNIYLEKNAVVNSRKEEINAEISEILKRDLSIIHQVSFNFSLAKLNYKYAVRDTYFEKAKYLLSLVEVKNNEYYLLERRIRFLELRLSFFTGKDLTTLIHLADEILNSESGFSIINNNTLFYKILFLVVKGDLEMASKLLEDKHVYFKGTSGILMENFLLAVIHENSGDFKKAIQLLNPIMYSSQYFFAVFARLLLIKIHLKRENRALCKSLIDSTSKFLIQNSGNPLGMKSNEIVLDILKKRISNRKEAAIGDQKLTVFHTYLIA